MANEIIVHVYVAGEFRFAQRIRSEDIKPFTREMNRKYVEAEVRVVQRDE